jgi:hypothetical protein
MPTLDDLFNSEKVHRKLAEMLPAGSVLITHADRFSLAEADGIVTQVLSTTGRYINDPDVAAYLQIDPADATIWDATNPARLASAVADAAGGAMPYGSVWVRGRDVHPHCRHHDVVAAIVLIGMTLFVRATTSAVKRAIRRPDGPDENTWTVLLAQLVRHYSPQLLRFDEDTTRAARDDLSSGVLADVCVGRGAKVQFGTGQQWDPQDPMQQQMLKQLLGLGAIDDSTRRYRLTGKRLQKLVAGGVPRSERQLPHGYRHARDPEGARLQVDGKGFVPEAIWDFVPVMQELVRLHAGGESYVNIGRRMAELGVDRRGQKRVTSLADLVNAGDLQALAEAAKAFFTNAGASPSRQADLYLQKVRLWRTGIYRTEVANEIRGRGITVAGLTPTYRRPDDEHGYFDVQVTWPWPVDPVTGEPLEAWGVAEELAKSEARLVAEIGTPRPTGGAAHRVSAKRAVTPTEWIENGRVHSVQPRQHNSGQNSCVIFSNTEAARQGRRGWSIERTNPKDHASATFPLTELCASLATSIERSVIAALDPATLAPVTVDRCATDDPNVLQNRRVADLEAKLAANLTAEQSCRDDAEGQELLAGRRLKSGDEPGATKAESRAAQLLSEADRLAAARSELDAAIDAVRQESAAPAADEPVEASLNTAAYLIAGLRRAQRANGIGPAMLAELVAEHVTGWHLNVTADEVRWTATLSLPLLSGGTATTALHGVLDNVRSPNGGRAPTSGAILAEQVLAEGRSLDDIASASGVKTSRRSLLIMHLMPWLKEHAVTSRGACCALIDHPLHEVQALLHSHLAAIPNAAGRTWSQPLQTHLIDTYTDPETRWGFAAVPDDTATIQRIVDSVVSAGTEGTLIDDLAAATAWTAKSVRELAHPYERNGFTRPIFLSLHPDDPARLSVLACTHCRRDQRSPADRVVLLPEVARSGYGVLCVCGRPPVTRTDPDHAYWKRVAFPPAYTSAVYTRIARSSLRDEPQTGIATDLGPLALPQRKGPRHSSTP